MIKCANDQGEGFYHYYNNNDNDDKDNEINMLVYSGVQWNAF